MATSLRTKRMLRERPILEKPSDDFFVFFNDEDLFTFHAYVLGPADTLYAYKLIKLKIQIPEKYPLYPPKCTFVQHSGGRIHPNLYVEGKVCLSILGTWPGEPWALAMSVETVLITVRSLLDNTPYKHEPGQNDNPDFNNYVRCTTWRCLLIDYIQKETDPSAKAFLQRHVNKNGQSMIKELEKHASLNSGGEQLGSPYDRWSKNDKVKIDFASLRQELSKIISDCKVAEATRSVEVGQVDSAGIKAKMVNDAPERDSDEQHGPKKKAKSSESASTSSSLITKLADSNSYIDSIVSKVGLKVTTPTLSTATDENEESPLKRKHEVIDLT